MADVPTITTALTFFSRAFDQGRNALFGDVQTLFRAFLVLEVVFAGIYIAIGGGGDLRAAAKKILIIGFFSWVITNYSDLVQMVLDGFIYTGQKAANQSGANLSLFQNPTDIFVLGCQKIKPLFDKLYSFGWSDFLSADALLLLFCGIVTCLSFGLIAIQVFVTYLEYLLISSLGFILIPFGIFKPLQFLSEKTFGAIIAFGIKFMTLALIIGVSQTFLDTVVMPNEVSWQQAFNFMIIAMALTFLAFHAPSVAVSLLRGAPHLSAGTVAASAMGGALATRALAGTTGTATSAMAAGGATVAGSMVGGATAAARQMGTSRLSGSPLSQVAQATSKAAYVAMGAVSGAAAGAASSIYEKTIHGQNGSPNGANAMRLTHGSQTAAGMKGAFEKGLYSVPQYRKAANNNKKEANREPAQPKDESGDKQNIEKGAV